MKRFNELMLDWLPVIGLILIFYCILCYLDFHRAVLPPTLNW